MKVRRQRHTSFSCSLGVSRVPLRGLLIAAPLVLVLLACSFCSAQGYPFASGEKLTYVVKLRGVPMGEQVLEVGDGPTIGGHKTLRLFSSVKTSRVLSIFHRVDDQIVSYVDASTLMSLRTKIRFKEGGRLRSYDVTVDPQGKVVKFWNRVTNKKWEHPASLPVFDFVSLIYWLRTVKASSGPSLNARLIDTGLTWGRVRDIEIKIGEIEKVSSYAGGFSARKYSETGDDSQITVWISQDEEKLPVRVQLSSSAGPITAYLSSVEHSGG